MERVAAHCHSLAHATACIPLMFDVVVNCSVIMRNRFVPRPSYQRSLYYWFILQRDPKSLGVREHLIEFSGSGRPGRGAVLVEGAGGQGAPEKFGAEAAGGSRHPRAAPGAAVRKGFGGFPPCGGGAAGTGVFVHQIRGSRPRGRGGACAPGAGAAGAAADCPGGRSAPGTAPAPRRLVPPSGRAGRPPARSLGISRRRPHTRQPPGGRPRKDGERGREGHKEEKGPFKSCGSGFSGQVARSKRPT